MSGEAGQYAIEASSIQGLPLREIRVGLDAELFGKKDGGALPLTLHPYLLFKPFEHLNAPIECL